MRIPVAMVALPLLLSAPAPAAAEEAGFMLCEALPHITCVWSGDSFFLRGELIRLADIVAPERYTSACPAASNLSWLAARRLRDLLNAGAFELDAATTGQDPRARLVTRDGRSLGDLLIEEGFARPKVDAPPDWCG